MGGMKIEKNIPIPIGKVSGLTSLMRKMKVGDSVAVPASAGVYTQAMLAGIKVTTRKEAAGGVRIWRIK